MLGTVRRLASLSVYCAKLCDNVVLRTSPVFHAYTIWAMASCRTGGFAMPKDSISKTAQVNLLMLSFLGVPEAVRFSNALKLEGNPLVVLNAMPLARRLPLCISCVSEVLYQRANELILEADNPTILDVACGYSPRVLLMAPRGYTYIGADLPDVIDDLMAHRAEILPPDAEWLAGYRTVDATDREQMVKALGALREPLTVVTEGLLSYLSLDEKRAMASSIRELLLRDGGCWVIPDVDSGTFVKDTFRAVLGGVATGVIRSVIALHDKHVGRDRSKMTWCSADEVTDALVELGFNVRRVPLYRDGMDLLCLRHMDEAAAEKLRACWRSKSAIVATV